MAYTCLEKDCTFKLDYKHMNSEVLQEIFAHEKEHAENA